MHKQLQRQLKKSNIKDFESDINIDNFKKLLSYIDLYYEETDATIQRLSRVLEISTTELKELNENLKKEIEKNRQKDKIMYHQSRLAQMGEMLSMIAHQWRQPLTAISSTSETIKLKASLGKLDSKSAKELSDKITKYTQHLSSTINDFRNFFKHDKVQHKVSLKKILNEVLDITEISIKNKDIKLITDVQCDKEILTYPNELKQVLLNLIKNSEDVLVEKNIEKKCINIVIYCKENSFFLEVSDNAGGVPEEIIDKIFEPYFSTKTKKDGTGLGLYMSKIIIEDHCEGNLSVKNDTDGAIFTVQLNLIET